MGEENTRDRDIDHLIRAAFEEGDTKALLLVWDKFAKDVAKKVAKKTDDPRKNEIESFIFDRLLIKTENKRCKIKENCKGFLYRSIFNEFIEFFRAEKKEEDFLSKLNEIYSKIYSIFPQDSRREICRKIVWEFVKSINDNLSEDEKMIANSIMGKIPVSKVIELMGISTRRYYYEVHLLLKKTRRELYQLVKSNAKFEDIIIDGFGHDGLKKLTGHWMKLYINYRKEA